MSTQTESQTVTIASGGTVSTAIQASREAAWGLQMPAAFTGTSITFQASADGSTFQALYEYDTTTDDGSATRAVTLAVAAARSYDLPAALTAWKAFKIVSGSAEAAARTLVVVGKAP
jgi:hypothetical protein